MRDNEELLAMRDANVRLVNACLNVAYKESGDAKFIKYCSDPSEGNKRLNQFVANANKNLGMEKIDEFTKNLIVKAKQALLPLSELKWLEENDRVCYLVWNDLKKSFYYSHPSHPVYKKHGDLNVFHAPTYTDLGLKINPSSSKERFNEIVKYFDSVELSIDWRLTLVEYLKNAYSQVLTLKRPFPWLDIKNEVQCLWTRDYIKKIDTTDKPPFPNYWSSSTEELYLAIYFAYDSWQSSKEAKKLFEINLSKAWQQKKYRDNLKGKKACNLVLRDDVKSMLDELAQVKGVKLNQLVEQLIEKEYKNI